MFWMMLFGAFLILMGLYGCYVDRKVDRKVERIQKKCKAKEPRLKEREDHWAA